MFEVGEIIECIVPIRDFLTKGKKYIVKFLSHLKNDWICVIDDRNNETWFFGYHFKKIINLECIIFSNDTQFIHCFQSEKDAIDYANKFYSHFNGKIYLAKIKRELTQETVTTKVWK